MAYNVPKGAPKSSGGGKGGGKGKFSVGKELPMRDFKPLKDRSYLFESPAFTKPTTQKRYPGGEIIPPSLPEGYKDARGAEKQCGNCYFNKNGYCSLWEAKIKLSYVCAKWGAPSQNQNLIPFEKQAYGSRRVTENVVTEFSELTQNNKKDLETFFNLYNSLFFDIPKEGIESHEVIMKRSRDYLNNFIDPKDATIEALQDEIEHLNGTLLNNSLKASAVTNNLDQFDNIEDIEIPKIELNEPSGETPELRQSWKDDPSSEPTVGEKVLPVPAGADENNDGIEDSKQTLSAYGTVMLFCQNSGNLSRILKRPDHWYYRPEYYGKPIYCFLRKLPWPSENNANSNLIVVNLGSKGQNKFRFLKVMGSRNGDEFRIPKKFWNDRNSWPSGKNTGEPGYALEPL